jgi:hypothetical protein
MHADCVRASVETVSTCQPEETTLAREKLIDVVKDEHNVLHTFPVEPPEPEPADGRFHEKALSAATHAQLVPADELNKLSTRDHVSRGGSITPYGDSHDIMTETKAALHQSVSERAYFLWEQANQPDGRADDFWHQAREEHFRDRAHRLWEYEGRPEGQADRHWQWTCDYEDK